MVNSQPSSSKDGSTPMDLLGEFKQLKEVEDFQAVNNPVMHPQMMPV